MKGTLLVKAFKRVKERLEAARMNIRERLGQVLVLRYEKERYYPHEVYDI